MPPIVDLHPSGSVLAAGSSMLAVLLPANSRTPTTYVITNTTAATANANSLSLTSVPNTTLRKGAIISFPGNVNVEVATDTAVNGTATAVPVVPSTVTDAIAAAATSNYLGMLELLGLQGIDESVQKTLISIRSMKSGLANDQRATMRDQTYSLNGWYHREDEALKTIIRPAARSDIEIYFEINYTDGETIRGVAIANDATRTGQLDDVMKYQFTLIVNGDPTYETAA